MMIDADLVPPAGLVSVSAPYDTRWQKFRLRVLARDHFTCQVFGVTVAVTDLEVDHTVPLGTGGARLDGANCQTVCRSCHHVKGLWDETKAQRLIELMPAKYRTADQGEKLAVHPFQVRGPVPADKIDAGEAVVAPPLRRRSLVVHLDPIDFFGELLSHW
jgi:hypothetical protein